MSLDPQEQFQKEYQAGQYAFERGQYRQSVQHLEKASELASSSSRVGGEVKMWLVTAYQANSQLTEAIALCRELGTHPHPEIRKQSKRLLYIIEAPRLKRPQNWMTEIPDLANLSSEETGYQQAKRTGTTKSKPAIEPDAIDLSQVDTKDNQFIWVALGFILLVLGGTIWLAF